MTVLLAETCSSSLTVHCYDIRIVAVDGEPDGSPNTQYVLK